jgi:hypothetical protein
MATRKQALKAIEKQGGAVDWDVSEITSREKAITIDAAGGSEWVFSGCASIALFWHSGSASEFWEEVVYMISFGIIKQGE